MLTQYLDLQGGMEKNEQDEANQNGGLEMLRNQHKPSAALGGRRTTWDMNAQTVSESLATRKNAFLFPEPKVKS